jgi:hypothetical protein
MDFEHLNVSFRRALVDEKKAPYEWYDHHANKQKVMERIHHLLFDCHTMPNRFGG